MQNSKEFRAKPISVVIPTLNEEGNIANVISGIGKVLRNYKYEIIVVDGHSKDKTVMIAKRLGARVIYDNLGKGSALVRGLNKAGGDVLISMDADMSNEPKELIALITNIEKGYDMCAGSRFMKGGGSEDIPFIRKIGNKFFVHLVNAIFRAQFTDMCYGYRSFSRTAFGKLRLKEKGFGIETEINIQAVKAGLKIKEIPSFEKKRESGQGKLRTFRDGYVIFRTIVKNIGG